MNRTIYLPDEEAETWERARRLANDRLSPVIVKALKEFVAVREAEAKGYERIQVEFEDSGDNNLPKIKAFHGKWIFSPSKPLIRERSEDGTERDVFCVATTAKGKVVVYMWKSEIRMDGPDPGEAVYGARFLVFPSFNEAAYDSSVNYAVRQAIRKRGVPVEELDI